MARVDFDQPFSLKVAENISFLDIPDEMRWKRDIFYLYLYDAWDDYSFVAMLIDNSYWA